MKELRISDTTLKLNKTALSFRKKIDIASILDSLCLPVIELGEFTASTEERLLLKTLASTVSHSILSVSVGISGDLAASCMDCLRETPHPRLQVSAGLSIAQMEYVYGKKQKDMLAAVVDAIRKCRASCEDVEFCAEDATRTNFDFLKTVLSEAIEAGAATITLCDSAGDALPDEFTAFLEKVKQEIPALRNVALAVECRNTLGLADACTASAMRCGVEEIKASAYSIDGASLSGLIRIFNAKPGLFPYRVELKSENMAQPLKVIANLCDLTSHDKTPFETGVREMQKEFSFTERDSQETIVREIAKLGYILSGEDEDKVYGAFQRIVSRKNSIDLHELEVIVASEALQVPRTYTLKNSIVTTGSVCDALAHIKLERNGEELDGVSLGNGAVDASFLAIEKITGCHYELDDFQIQAITEGKEAMGQTLVKLRSQGKVYSGKGVSTDIVMSAIEAYLNALNKIVYEEEQI